MKHLSKVKTESEYEQLVGGGNMKYQHVAYVGNTETVHYNSKFVPREEAEAGTIIAWHKHSDGTIEQAFIRPEAWENDGYWTADAIVVVPYSHTDDGTVRAMALKYASLEDPANGSKELELMCFGYESSHKDGAGVNVYISSSDQENNIVTVKPTGNLAVESNFAGSMNPNDVRTRYISPPRIPSPYNEDGSKNVVYHDVNSYTHYLDGWETCLKFWMQYSNTKEYGYSTPISSEYWPNKNSTLYGFFPAIAACNRYSSVLKPCLFNSKLNFYTNIRNFSMPWYLPSFGELGYYVARFNTIENSISLITGQNRKLERLWSNTATSTNTYVFQLANEYGQILISDSRYGYVQASTGGAIPFTKF